MTLSCRNSEVGRVFMNTVSQASILQFGDTRERSTLTNRVIAIQQAIPDFQSDELRFASYPLYYRPLPTPPALPPVSFNVQSDHHAIRVASVKVIGLSNSALSRFGCGGPLQAEARIVNIRRFNRL